MKSMECPKFTAIGVLLLTLGSASGPVQGRTSTQNTKSPAVASPAQSQSEDERETQNLFPEQFQNIARIQRQVLQAQLANLRAQIAKETEMSASQLKKLKNLSAQFQNQDNEWEAGAQELASRATELSTLAEEKAAKLLGQDSRVFSVSQEDSSGWLGVEISEVTPDNAKELKASSIRGVVVTDVEADSPAGKADLKENDIVTKYDGQTVEGTVQFRRFVRETPPGRTVALTILRNGSTQNISVELGDRNAFYEKKMQGKMRDFGNSYSFVAPKFDFDMDRPEIMGAMDWRTPLLGINAEDLSGQLGAYFGAPDGTGVLVREVRSGTPAEKAGLKAGDVIIKINDKPVHSLGELRQQLREKSDQKSASLGILRKGSEMSISITIEKPQPIEPTRLVHRAQL